MRFTSTFAVVCALGILSPTVLMAQAAPNNEALHRQGMALRTQHRNEEARALFEHLWNRTAEPRARARQALAEQALGLFAEVESHLVEALSHESDPWISQNRFVLVPILEQARAGQRVSILQVRSSTPQAEVYINGAAAGPVGGALRVLPGSVTFIVRAPGFADVERTVQLRAGATANEEVTLERVAAVQATSTTVATSTMSSAAAITVVPPRRVRAPSATLRTLAWVSAGGSAAFAITAVTAQILMMNAAFRWNSDAICGSDPQQPSPGCLDDAQRALDMDVLRTIGYVGAGALAVTSVALFVIPSVGSRREARVRCVPSFGATVVTCGGAF